MKFHCVQLIETSKSTPSSETTYTHWPAQNCFFPSPIGLPPYITRSPLFPTAIASVFTLRYALYPQLLRPRGGFRS
jgi:hypothetical protein